MSALQMAAPEWLHDPKGLRDEVDAQGDRIVALEQDVENLGKMIAAVAKRVGELAR